MKRIVLLFFGSLILFLVATWLFSSFEKVEKVELKINRFEQELFSINAENVIEKSNRWDETFGSFNEVFTTQIMQISQLL